MNFFVPAAVAHTDSYHQAAFSRAYNDAALNTTSDTQGQRAAQARRGRTSGLTPGILEENPVLREIFS